MLGTCDEVHLRLVPDDSPYGSQSSAVGRAGGLVSSGRRHKVAIVLEQRESRGA